MAMATALAGSSLSVAAAVQKSSGVWGQDLRRLRISSPRTSLKKLSVSAALTNSEQSHIVDDLSQGASAIAGALFAAMATSDSAMAAQQMMALAESDDSRGLALLIPVVPALGWVLYNILQPGLNQYNNMKSAKGLVAGLGLGALGSIVFSSEAEAAVQEITQLADSDSRGLAVLVVLLPAIGWVLYNILQPALNQLDKMRSAKGIIGAAGLGGLSLLLAPHADAVQEITQLADNDSRGLAVLFVLIPALGWVLFNILQPGLNQFNKMRNVKGLTGAIGLGAATASFLAAQDADAAQEITTLAADNRPTVVLFVLVPAIGWVLYNILKPALNQFNKMKDGK